MKPDWRDERIEKLEIAIARLLGAVEATPNHTLWFDAIANLKVILGQRSESLNVDELRENGTI